MIKILIADDYSVLINGLRLILAVRTDFKIVGIANTGAEVIEQIQNECPDIILLDINMPVLNGYQTMEVLQSDYSQINVIVLSMLNDKRNVLNMLEAGAKGYLFKDTDDNQLFKAIEQVYQGGYYLPKDLDYLLDEFLEAGKSTDKKIKQLLSPRELEIVSFIIEGYTNAEIADLLFLSTRTVDTHRKNIFYKLNLNNTASLVKYALENRAFLGLP